METKSQTDERGPADLRFDWPDIDCVATMTLGAGDAHVDFACYQVVAWGQDKDGKFTVKEFERRGAVESLDTVTDLAEAQPLFSGSIKWDACSHVYFGEGDNFGYIHMCGADMWRSLPKAIERIFAEAGKLLKRGHNDEFFDE
jgi:hypothetical protein